MHFSYCFNTPTGKTLKNNEPNIFLFCKRDKKSEFDFFEPGRIATMKQPLRRTLVQDFFIEPSELDEERMLSLESV